MVFYNGHYRKNERGGYEIEYFPIPVVSLEGVCDIEIGFDEISVTAKLTRDMAASFDFERLKGYRFEVYGVQNCLDDFYTEGDGVGMIPKRVAESGESEVFLSFSLKAGADAGKVCELVGFLKREGFYY